MPSPDTARGARSRAPGPAAASAAASATLPVPRAAREAADCVSVGCAASGRRQAPGRAGPVCERSSRKAGRAPCPLRWRAGPAQARPRGPAHRRGCRPWRRRGSRSPPRSQDRPPLHHGPRGRPAGARAQRGRLGQFDAQEVAAEARRCPDQQRLGFERHGMGDDPGAGGTAGPPARREGPPTARRRRTPPAAPRSPSSATGAVPSTTRSRSSPKRAAFARMRAARSARGSMLTACGRGMAQAPLDGDRPRPAADVPQPLARRGASADSASARTGAW
jgi:hypothetical protein